MTVTRHHGQDRALRGAQCQGQEHLQGAAREGDGALGFQGIDQHERHKGGCATDIHEGEVAEEEVHGAVQAGVQHVQPDEEGVPQHYHGVDAQAEYKQYHL